MVARFIIAGLDWIQRHPLPFVVLFFAILMCIHAFVGMVTGDWDATLAVLRWVGVAFCFGCLGLMLTMIVWAKPFREAAKELGVAPDESEASSKYRERIEKQ